MNDEIMRRYGDIIDLPHPEPVTRPRMTAENRAAQFSPFAALTGYDYEAKETIVSDPPGDTLEND